MTTFISYSRVNADFAVSIAKDLKLAGFDVWLDQLDIPTGSRWDDEIEKALEASNIFLIILSPESIQSQNVKDEIGYAIDSGKHILPVVIKNCKVPFRLRRFQYVDFTAESYEQSLVKIKYLLGNTRELSAVKNDTDEGEKKDTLPPSNNLIAQERPIPELGSVNVKAPVPVKPELKWKSPVLIVAACIIVLALAILFKGKPTVTDSTPMSGVTFTALVQTSTPVPFTETSTSIPPSETPTPFPEEITDAKGVSMRLVPAGEFIMGSDNGDVDERPAHNVNLGAYYIDKYEVTNALYSVCATAGACDPPKLVSSLRRASYYGNSQFDNYPVVQVDWNMAKTYCEWRGAQLPTEAQWEKAARGTDGRTYPWAGEGLECSKANYGGCVQETNFIGGNESGKSIYGVYDMAGNVWEWVADWYSADYYQNSPTTNPLGPGAGVNRAMRGGSWSDLGSSSRSANRHGNTPQTFGNSLGFRCALGVIP
jgi:formylglycine-generating enzyme required for sulfatase activity